MIERRNPLFAVTQVTRNVTSNQCWTRLTLTSEYLDFHILLWNKLRTLVIVTLSRRSRTTLTANLFKRYQQQNKAYNPFSTTQKKMIQDVGSVELFEFFEADRKTQCRACLSYWSEGIVCCTCGHLLKEAVANRNFIVYTMDLLPIPEYVIKKGRPHGHRYGKTAQKEYHLAHNLKKRCVKMDFKEIHDRFFRDHVFRERMIQHNRDEEVCRKRDDLADEDHTYRISESEYFHYRQKWWISLKSGRTQNQWENVLTSNKRCLH